MAPVPPALRSALSDRYRIEREVGRGGMAAVYLAEDLRHHRQVAVKVLNPEVAAALGSERFLREIEIAVWERADPRFQPVVRTPRPHRRRSDLVCLALALLGAAGCSTPTPPTPPPDELPVRIVVSPQVDTINALDHTRQLQVRLYGSSGRELDRRAVQWHSTTPAIATVDPALGLVTARSVGRTRIVAVHGTLSDSADVTVRQVARSVSFTPHGDTIVVGSSIRLQAVATDSNGRPMPASAIRWASSNPLAIVVDSAGTATGRQPGFAVLRADAESAADSAVFRASTGLPVRVRITPTHWGLRSGRSQPFRAVVTGVAETGVTWRVRPGRGGGPAGSMSPLGLYTAPTTTSSDTVRVQAVSQADSSVVAEARVAIAPDTGGAAWQFVTWDPMVFDPASDDSVKALVHATGFPDSVALTPTFGAAAFRGRADSTGWFSIVLSAAQLQQASLAGSPGLLPGRIALYLHGTALPAWGTWYPALSAGAAMPAVQRVSAYVQLTDHVVNVRVDSISGVGVPSTAEVERLALRHVPVPFDNLVIFSAGQGATPSFGGGAHCRPQCAVAGMAFINTGLYHAGLDTRVVYHELGHAWMVFPRRSSVFWTGNHGHWPPSTLANGIMGIQLGGASCRGTLQSLGNGRWQLDIGLPTVRFNEMELYLLGLIPADSVPRQTIFTNPTGPLTWCDSIIDGPTVQVTADQFDGTVRGAYPSAPTTFRVVPVVLSLGRLLSGSEMAYFEQVMSRAELEDGREVSFRNATGGRASLTSRVR